MQLIAFPQNVLIGTNLSKDSKLGAKLRHVKNKNWYLF